MRMIHKKDMDLPEYRGPKLRKWAGFNVLPATVGEQQLIAAVPANPLLGNFDVPACFSNQYACIVESIYCLCSTNITPVINAVINGTVGNFNVNGKDVMKNVLLAALPPDFGLQEAVAIPAAALAAVEVGYHKGQRYNMGSWRPLVAKGENATVSINIPVALGVPVGGVIVSLWFEIRAIGYIE